MSAQYACQISCYLNGIKQRFLLDTINKVVVNTSSELTSHPIAQGDYVGDHMYRDQATLRLDGEWSISSGSNLNLGSKQTKLISFQSIFETIKNKGIICEILQISKNENSSNRFLKRTNMVLTDITWQEGITNVEFNFTFKQLITTDAATNASNYLNVTQNLGTFDSSDSYLPSYDVMIRNSFTSLTINYIGIISTLIKDIFYQNENTFALYNRMKMLGERGFSSLGFTSNESSIIANVMSSYSLSEGDKLFYNGFYGLINSTSYSRKYNSKSIKNSDIINAAKYILAIYNKIMVLSNDISVYQPSSSGEQTSLLLINNNTYEFSFKRNNTNETYYLSIKNANADNKEFMTSSIYCQSAVNSFSNCTGLNHLLKLNKTYVYLAKAKDLVDTNLTNYFIIMTNILPIQFSQELSVIINEG